MRNIYRPCKALTMPRDELAEWGRTVVIYLIVATGVVILGRQEAYTQIVNGDFETHTCIGSFAFQGAPPCAGGSWFVSHGTPDLFQNVYGNSTTFVHMWYQEENDTGEGLFVECPTFLAGHTYRLQVRFFTDALVNDPLNHVFIKLATGLVHAANINNNHKIPTPTSSQIIQDLQNFSCGGPNSTVWRPLNFTFTPDTNYTQLWFYPFGTGRHYLYMDDVSVTETDACPVSQTYLSFSGTPALTEVKDYIYAYGTSHVDPGQQVVFRAGHYIHLGPNFHAAPGAGYFHAFIAPCTWEQPIQSCRDNGGISSVGDDPTAKVGSRGMDDAGDNGWVRGLSPEGVHQEKLLMNYPNPFTGKTMIEYMVPEEGKVELVVLNMLGQKVAELVSGVHQLAGQYRVEFDGSALPAGTYYYTLRAGSFTTTQKMVLAP